MRIRAFKYLSPFLIYVGAIHAFYSAGIGVWLPLIYSFVLVPLLELFLKPNETNLSAAEEEIAKEDPVYDWFLYLVVPLQYFALACFLYSVTVLEQAWWLITGKTAVMGLLCGTFGINVGHELGHRKESFEQALAKMLLLSSLYMHFFIEHNKGHHKKVGTMEDPATARFGETVYGFYLRSIIFSYMSAWEIAARDARKKGYAVLSLHNEMILYHLIQLSFVVLVVVFFGIPAAGLFLAAALMGILLLETVNYIEHYGLHRRQLSDGRYERAMPHHSWNSNHVIGRVMLFELSRHSDHHYLASRKYQVLRHHDHTPQMPTGYPGMMILSLLPPAWFYIMNKRVKEWQ